MRTRWESPGLTIVPRPRSAVKVASHGSHGRRTVGVVYVSLATAGLDLLGHLHTSWTYNDAVRNPLALPSDIAVRVLSVWFHALGLGSRERGGRTLLQKGESKDNLPTIFVMNVCPSHSRFQPITADIERSRKRSKEARFRALKAVARVRIPSGLQLNCLMSATFCLSQLDHLRLMTHR